MKKQIINLSKDLNVTGEGNHVGGNCKPVLCITTGRYYSSIMDAADGEHVHYSALSACLRGKCKTCHGKQFVYADKQIYQSYEIMKRLREAYEMEADAKAYREMKAEKERKEKEKEEMRNKIEKTKNEISKLNNQIDTYEEKRNKVQEDLYYKRINLENYRKTLEMMES